MSGHRSPLAMDFFSVANLESNSHSSQIFSAGYTSRLYMYISIHNRYSDAAPIIRQQR